MSLKINLFFKIIQKPFFFFHLLHRFVEHSDSTRRTETVTELSIHRPKLKHHPDQSNLLSRHLQGKVAKAVCKSVHSNEIHNILFRGPPNLTWKTTTSFIIRGHTLQSGTRSIILEGRIDGKLSINISLGAAQTRQHPDAISDNLISGIPACRLPCAFIVILDGRIDGKLSIKISLGAAQIRQHPDAISDPCL
jgi:hypothetical protein